MPSELLLIPAPAPVFVPALLLSDVTRHRHDALQPASSKAN